MPSSVTLLAVGRWPATEKLAELVSPPPMAITPGARVATVFRSEASVGSRAWRRPGRRRCAAPGRRGRRAWPAARGARVPASCYGPQLIVKLAWAVAPAVTVTASGLGLWTVQLAGTPLSVTVWPPVGIH